MEKVHLWCLENKLTLNAKKSEYVIYGTKKKCDGIQNFTLNIGKDRLNRVDSYKYLGTVLDSTLNGVKQLDKVRKQIAIKLMIFRKIRMHMSEKTAKMIYKSTILPILDYNDIIYNLLTKQQKLKLQRLQNSALRIVFKGRIMSVALMHKEANVSYLTDRRDSHLLALMLDRTREPKYRDTTVRQTRQATAPLLKVPKPNTAKLTRVPIYWGSVEWNNLPPAVRRANSRLDLKRLLRMNHTGRSLDESGEETNKNSL